MSSAPGSESCALKYLILKYPSGAISGTTMMSKSFPWHLKVAGTGSSSSAFKTWAKNVVSRGVQFHCGLQGRQTVL